MTWVTRRNSHTEIRETVPAEGTKSAKTLMPVRVSGVQNREVEATWAEHSARQGNAALERARVRGHSKLIKFILIHLYSIGNLTRVSVVSVKPKPFGFFAFILLKQRGSNSAAFSCQGE